MAPTKSIYRKTIDQRGKPAPAEKGLKGEDYLQYWASVNVQEGLELERKEGEARAAKAAAAEKAGGRKKKAANARKTRSKTSTSRE